MYLYDLQQTSLGLLHSVGEGLGLQVLGVHDAECHLKHLVHQVRHNLHWLLTLQQLQPA